MVRIQRCRYGNMAYLPNDMFVGRALALYGQYSEDEVALFRQLVKPGFTVLEVGANIGALTVPLAQMAGPQGQVQAFEPQRTIFYLLCANVVLNNLNNVLCHQAAVAEAPGKLLVPDIDYSQTRNFGGVALGASYSCATYDVPVVRIDDLRCSRCDFIKVDAEGMEKQVLEGAVETIGAFRPLLYLEDDPRENKSPELHAFLQRLGYDFRPHLPGFYDPENIAGNQVDVFTNSVSRNLLCWHRAAPLAFDEDEFATRALRAPFARGCIMQGLALYREGRLGDAADACRQALHWQPDYVDALDNLGIVQEEQSQIEEAGTSYQQALECQPRRADIAEKLANVGLTLRAQRKLDAAGACYRQILRCMPSWAPAHNTLGMILLDQGQPGHAIACFEEAIRLQRDYPEARQNLAAAKAIAQSYDL